MVRERPAKAFVRLGRPEKLGLPGPLGAIVTAMDDQRKPLEVVYQLRSVVIFGTPWMRPLPLCGTRRSGKSGRLCELVKRHSGGQAGKLWTRGNEGFTILHEMRPYS
jgi:hypothetical protein